MSKDNVIEAATYILVLSAMWVVSPLLAKWLDSLYFHYPHVLTRSSWLLLLGAFIFSLGMVLGFWTVFLFKTQGQGTPNPRIPPKNFIVSGPYSYTRNPMALGGLLILLGQSMFYHSPSLLGLSLLYGVILYCYIMRVEEPELRKRFGAPYDDYLKNVPRFFPNPRKRFK